MTAANAPLPLLPSAPRGWHRPVRPVALLVVGVLLLLIWLVLITGAVWYFYARWEARVTLHDQKLTLLLPAGMPAMAEVTSPIRSKLDFTPQLHLPIKQNLTAKFDDHVQVRAQVHTMLAVDTSVNVDQVVPVRTVLNVDVPVHAWLPRMKLAVPVTLSLPVHMVVPVKSQVPVDLDVVVSGDLPKSINVPLDATLDLSPHVKGAINARMSALTEFRLVAPVPPVELSIEHADLRVPFNLTFLSRRLP